VQLYSVGVGTSLEILICTANDRWEEQTNERWEGHRINVGLAGGLSLGLLQLLLEMLMFALGIQAALPPLISNCGIPGVTST